MLAPKLRMGLMTAERIDYALDFAGGTATDRVVVTDAAPIQNIWDGGGSFRAKIRADGIGGGNLGRIFQKASKGFYLYDSDGNKCRLYFYCLFIDGGVLKAGQWYTNDRVITFGETYNVRVDYNSNSVGNVPTFYINGSPISSITASTPAGTRQNDAGNDLYIGNRPGNDRCFDGIIDEPDLHNSGGRVWYSKLNSGSGTVAVDVVNGNNGAITGAQWVVSPFE